MTDVKGPTEFNHWKSVFRQCQCRDRKKITCRDPSCVIKVLSLADCGSVITGCNCNCDAAVHLNIYSLAIFFSPLSVAKRLLLQRSLRPFWQKSIADYMLNCVKISSELALSFFPEKSSQTTCRWRVWMNMSRCVSTLTRHALIFGKWCDMAHRFLYTTSFCFGSKMDSTVCVCPRINNALWPPKLVEVKSWW